MTYRLTARHGPRVTRDKFEDLESALEALEHHAKRIRSAGPLESRTVIREFDAAGQVAGRVEISSGRFLRGGREAGVDVMGDGALVAFKGGIRRTELDPGDQGPFAAVREALS